MLSVSTSGPSEGRWSDRSVPACLRVHTELVTEPSLAASLFRDRTASADTVLATCILRLIQLRNLLYTDPETVAPVQTGSPTPQHSPLTCNGSLAYREPTAWSAEGACVLAVAQALPSAPPDQFRRWWPMLRALRKALWAGPWRSQPQQPTTADSSGAAVTVTLPADVVECLSDEHLALITNISLAELAVYAHDTMAMEGERGGVIGVAQQPQDTGSAALRPEELQRSSFLIISWQTMLGRVAMGGGGASRGRRYWRAMGGDCRAWERVIVRMAVEPEESPVAQGMTSTLRNVLQQHALTSTALQLETASRIMRAERWVSDSCSDDVQPLLTHAICMLQLTMGSERKLSLWPRLGIYWDSASQAVRRDTPTDPREAARACVMFLVSACQLPKHVGVYSVALPALQAAQRSLSFGQVLRKSEQASAAHATQRRVLST